MGFYQEYELVGLVNDGPAKTLKAREIATGRYVYLHLLTGALDGPRQDALLERIESLNGASPSRDANPVLRIGEFAGTRYVVTDVLEPFTNLEDWVQGNCDSVTVASTKPIPVAEDERGTPADDDSFAAPPMEDPSQLLNLAPRLAETGWSRPAPAVPALGGLDSRASGSGAREEHTPPGATGSPSAGVGDSGSLKATAVADLSVQSVSGLQDQAGEPAAVENATTSVLADEAPEASPGLDETVNGASGPITLPASPDHRGIETLEPASGLRELTAAASSEPEPKDLSEDETEVTHWLSVAREHLDSDDLGRVLETLDRVLRVKPDDPEALRLAAEAKRRGEQEQQTQQAQQAKSRLYQSARQNWERAEISTALSELEALLALERRQPDPDAGRRTSYEEFHHQVRVEHDAIRSSCEEARAQFAEDNLSAALAICDEYLTKYPNQPQFQALKFEIGERRRQELIAFITDTDRRVDQEPDLDRRVDLLQEALGLHPGEKHFQEGLRLAREKRDLVCSTAEQARVLERQQRLGDALEQWRIVRSMHPLHPGLESATRGLEEKLQAHRVARVPITRWADQIRRALQSGNYERASELAKEARSEFPEEAEFLELGQQARERRERAGEAHELFARALREAESHHPDRALELLRQAYLADDRNGLLRIELINLLLAQARNRVDSEWESAEPLIEEILRLDPNNPSALTLLEQVAHQKREELVSWCLVEARRLKAEGDFASARQVIEDSLDRYPEDSRLRKLYASLEEQPDDTSRRQSRLEDLRELRRLELELSGVSEPTQVAALVDQTGIIAARHRGDDEVQSVAEQIRDEADKRLTPPGPGWEEPEPPVRYRDSVFALPGPPPAAPDETPEPEWAGNDLAAPEETTAFDEPEAVPDLTEWHRESFRASTLLRDSSEKEDSSLVASYPERYSQDEDEDLLTRLSAQRNVTTLDGEEPPEEPGADSDSEASPLKSRLQAGLGTLLESIQSKLPPPVKNWPVIPTLLGAVVAVVLLLVLTGTIVWKLSRPGAAVPAAVAIPIMVRSSPPGATVSVNGEICGVSECEPALSPGSYRAEARLEGYQAAVVSFEVNGESPNGLAPILLNLTPLAPLLQISSDLDGQVSLDGKSLGELEDGVLEMELADLSPGEHTVEVKGGGASASLKLRAVPGSRPEIVGPAKTNNIKAAIVAGLGSNAIVYTSDNGVAASLDGKSLGSVGIEGRVLSDLSPGPHQLALGEGKERRTVVVDIGDRPLLAAYLNSDRNVGAVRIATAENDVVIYLNGTKYSRKTVRGTRLIYLYPKKYIVRVEKAGFKTPAEQLVEVQKGEEVRLNFKLEPIPEMSSLRVADGIPGTEVLVDGQVLGTVGQNGKLSVPGLEPGAHKVQLRREHYRARELERDFPAGGSVSIDGALESTVGILKIQANPANVDLRLTLQREGESTQRTINEDTLYLPPGTYTVTGGASGYQDYSATVVIAIGQTKTVGLNMVKVQEQKRLVSAFGLDDWVKASGWRREGELLVRRGGGFVLASRELGAGAYTFTALLEKGKRLEWVVNFTDENNYVFYQLGKNYFHRTQVRNGKKSRTVKTPHNLPWDGFLSIQVEVSADAVVHKLLQGEQWTSVDRWEENGLANGKFGFHIPGRDEVGLSHFSFLPRP